MLRLFRHGLRAGWTVLYQGLEFLLRAVVHSLTIMAFLRFEGLVKPASPEATTLMFPSLALSRR